MAAWLNGSTRSLARSLLCLPSPPLTRLDAVRSWRVGELTSQPANQTRHCSGRCVWQQVQGCPSNPLRDAASCSLCLFLVLILVLRAPFFPSPTRSLALSSPCSLALFLALPSLSPSVSRPRRHDAAQRPAAGIMRQAGRPGLGCLSPSLRLAWQTG